MPEAIGAVDGLAENLRMQDRVAQSMKNFRHVHGALSLETIEARPIFDGDQIRDLEVREQEPRHGHYRGLHDRGKRRDRPVSVVERTSLPFAELSAVQNAGTESSRLPRSTDSGCRTTRTR